MLIWSFFCDKYNKKDVGHQIFFKKIAKEVSK